MTDTPPLVRLVWATPHGEEHLLYIARVSNPDNQNSSSTDLIHYLMKHGHWSPFEMVNICFEVNTTRDIGRQFLRHSTMRPQEFSQRYQDVSKLGGPVYREARIQDPKNRQKSIPSDDPDLVYWWKEAQDWVWVNAEMVYQDALRAGIAKEVARAVLPEGMTPSRIYFNAPLRTLLHMIPTRSLKGGAQREAADIADAVSQLVKETFPVVHSAWTKYVLDDA